MTTVPDALGASQSKRPSLLAAAFVSPSVFSFLFFPPASPEEEAVRNPLELRVFGNLARNAGLPSFLLWRGILSRWGLPAPFSRMSLFVAERNLSRAGRSRDAINPRAAESRGGRTRRKRNRPFERFARISRDALTRNHG